MWYFLLVAALNLAIGFALAVFQGRRARVGGLLLAGGPSMPLVPAKATAPAATPRAPQPELNVAAVVSDALRMPVEPQPAAPAEEPAAGENALDQASQVDRHAGEYQRQLATIDDQMRRAEELHPEQVASYVQQLELAHRDFLSEQDAVDRIALPIGAPSELEDAHTQLLALWQQQCKEVAEAERSLGAFEPQGDLPEQCEKIIHRNQKLLETGHKLRDTLGEEIAELARYEPGSRAAGSERSEGLMTRAQLESFLAEWWASHPDGAGQLSAVAVDVDEFSRVNQEFGSLAGDHVLQAIVQVLRGECGAECPVSRFTGDSFLTLMADVGVGDATTHVERVRQQIEHTHFDRQKKTVQVTVSCCVTQASPGDDTRILLERIEATLNEAKRYGRNRTFVHEGKYPTPVMPPKFEFAEKNVEL